MLDIPQEDGEEQVFDVSSLLSKDDDSKESEECEECEECGECEGCDEEDMDAAKEAVMGHIIPLLEKMAYDFGKQGKHAEAYAVERAIRDIEGK